MFYAYAFYASMSVMELTATLGWVATTLFTICYIPQIVKTARTNTVDGLSFWLLFISLIANMVALWYAARIAQTPLIVKYVGGIIFWHSAAPAAARRLRRL